MTSIISTVGQSEAAQRLNKMNQAEGDKITIEKISGYRESVHDLENPRSFFEAQMALQNLSSTIRADENASKVFSSQQTVIKSIRETVLSFLSKEILQDTSVLDVGAHLQAEAGQLLEMVEGFLNTTGPFGFLFSGDTQDQAPVQNLKSIPLDVAGNINTAHYYQGGTHVHQVNSNPDTPDVSIDLSLRGDDPSFSHIIKALANAREGNFAAAKTAGETGLKQLAYLEQTLETKKLSFESAIDHMKGFIDIHVKTLEEQNRLDLADLTRHTERQADIQFSKSSVIEMQAENRRAKDRLLNAIGTH